MIDAVDEAAPQNLFAGDSEMAMLMRSHDWSQTPLGTVETWSDSLKTAVQILLTELDRTQQPQKTQLESAQADAFRVRLTNALRPLTDANEIQAIAARILGESLGASRVIYVEVLPDGKEVIVHKNYANNVAELSGLYHLEEFGRNLTDDHLAGRTAIVPDVANYPKYTASQKASYQAIDIAAHIDVPLIKNQRFVALLAVHQANPRQWTEDEVKRVEETADQTWAAVERARAEAVSLEIRTELERQLRKFDAIVAAIPDFIYTFDLSGRFTYISPALLNLWQKTADEALGKNFSELDYPTDLATRHQEQIQQVIAARQPLKDEMLYTSAIDTRAYEYIFVPLLGVDGAVEAVAGVTRDITDRKLVEQALRQSEEKSRNILESIAEAFFALDENWQFIYVNRSAGALLDRTPGDLVGKNLWEEYPGLVGNELAQVYWSAMRDRVAASLTAFYPDHDRWYEVRTYPAPNGITVYVSNVTEQIQTAASLRQSEERYRTLFESMGDGFCVIEMLFDQDDRPIDYRFLEVNPSFEQQSGLVQAVGKRMLELAPDHEKHWFEIYGRIAITGEPLQFENYAKALNRWFEVYACRTGEAQARKVEIVFKDISDRKRVEEALRESEEQQAFLLKFSDALRAEPDADAVANRALRMLREQMQLDRCYIGVYRLTDDRGDFTHQVGNDRVPPLPDGVRLSDFPESLRVAFDRTLVIDDIAELEGLSDTDRQNLSGLGLRALVAATLRKGENNPLWSIVSVSAHPRRWTRGEIALVEEVTERTWAAMERARAEAIVAADLQDMERLRELGTRLVVEEDIQTLYQAILSTAIDLTQADAGTVQILEEATQELVLLTAQGFEQTMLKHFYRLNESSNTPCGIALKAGTRSLIDFDVPESEDPDGSRRILMEAGYLSGQSTPLITRSGKIIGMVSTHWRDHHQPSERELRFLDLLARQAADLIEQRQTAAEREKLLAREQAARAQADRANQIKDEFLAVLSHELRSPLSPILGWSKLMQLGKLDAAKTTRALETIERNALLQLQLIDDLLDISRILHGQLLLTVLPVDLSNVISEALETVRLAAEAKAIQIYTKILPSVGIVMGDAGRLQQVIWNLLSNAVKFTPHRGQVTVTLAVDETYAEIQVTDTGKGICSDFLPYVFEHFRQEDGATTRNFGGLGLGLAIVRQIVELHGGTVVVESPGEGQGATFTVRIPLAARFHELPAIEQPSDSTGDLSGIRVLVVDDEADSREFVAFVLEQAGAIVTSVGSGTKALQAFSQAVPEIIVSDIGMPEMDGYMLMRHIRSLPVEQGGQIPALALTAYAGEIDIKQAIAAGFQRHLAKPIDPETVVAIVTQLLSSG